MQVNLPMQRDVEEQLLLFLRLHRRPLDTKRVYGPLAEAITLTSEQRFVTITTPKGLENGWENLVRQARRRLVDEGLMVDRQKSQSGHWLLTSAGRDRANLLSMRQAAMLTIDDLGL
jgi:hypothetical protein